MTYRVVIIDDEREWKGPTGESITVDHYKTSDDGLAELHRVQAMEEKIDELWLDHDLGMDDSELGWDTIMPVVAWLEEQGRAEQGGFIGLLFIHSANVAAVPAMMDALRPYYTVVRAEFPRWIKCEQG